MEAERAGLSERRARSGPWSRARRDEGPVEVGREDMDRAGRPSPPEGRADPAETR